MNDPTPISDQQVLEVFIDPSGAHDLRQQIFREQLDQCWPTFDFKDSKTWPQQDGLYIGITRETGRVGAIILQWASREPSSVWRSVEVYAAVNDLLPTLPARHTHHIAHREVA